MSDELISPAAIMDLLHSPFPEDVRGGLHWTSFDMLRDLYRERIDDPLVQLIQSSLNHAIDEWKEEQVEDFWVNYLLDPPLSDEVREKSPQERRTALRQHSRYFFDRV
jgi:hypothetical protein